MIIPTNLIANPAIIQGLADGSLVRYGSIIRYAAGSSQGGQIVAHLADLGSVIPSNPISPLINAAGHAATYRKLGILDTKIVGLQQTATQILGFSQIAAGASVLGLGVSIAGFVYMGYKLHQVQKAIGNLQQSMDAGFGRVEDRLDQLAGHLAYLHLLVEDSRQQQQRLSNALNDLHKAFLMREIAALQAELESLNRFPDDSPRDALKASTSARLFLANQATQSTLELEPNTIMLVDVATQGWAVAAATESQLLLQHGHINDAKAVLDQTVPQFKQHAENWAGKLLQDQSRELTTAQRFATPVFQRHILPERVGRITRISPIDKDLSPDRIHRRKLDAEVEIQMSRTQPRITQHWQYQQIALAEYLDTLSELAARLESLQHFAQLCQSQNVKSSHELLPPADAQPGLYLLPAG